jgi:transcription antitermination factor NusG
MDDTGLLQSPDKSTAAWYALYTRSQHEKTVARALTNKGFEAFLPLYVVGHQWKDRTKRLSLPLFPCYVFLHDSLERRLDLLKTPGIYQIVSCCGRPAEIPRIEIEAVRQTVASSLTVEPHPLLRCGDLARVKTGPLAGIEGVLIRRKNLFRLVLSVEMLGKAVAVEVDGNQVERLGTIQQIPWSGQAGSSVTSSCRSLTARY